MKDLPRFVPHSQAAVDDFLAEIFTRGDHTFVRQVISYADHHYRVIFDLAYFVLPEGASVPSRSQWSTLKKKMKRHNARVFVFKAHGEIRCEGQSNDRCGYLDFGFLAS